MPVYYTDSTFNQYQLNPFDDGKPYNMNWILFRLIEKADDFQYLTAGFNDTIFRCIMTKEQKDWKYRLNDFIQYEAKYNKNIIIAVDEQDLKAATSEYGLHRYDDPYLRDYETRVLVHTTTKENYTRIVSSGELKCWNILKSENPDWEEKPIGSVLGDPVNYSEYVMFGTGGFYQELIPLSKQKGAIDMDVDGFYMAGARLYFSAESIATAGLLVRDGVHLKVKNRLPLEPHLLWTATPEVLGIEKQTTPRTFANTADRVFTEKFGISLDESCY